MKLERHIIFCEENNHYCCPFGYYQNLFLVINEKTQEVVKLFTCSIKAAKYTKKNNLWLIQSLRLDYQTLGEMFE